MCLSDFAHCGLNQSLLCSWIYTDTMQSIDHNWLEGSNMMAFFTDQYCSIKALAAMHI
ncbi:hypothetical protein EXN66_Car012314 [Channa argus]|uniref:Uncharacterized protein n=1 Tax=Channa argus TaxID=215402 RepID=A0A6G1Q371_CHAAH|nr:hypothetical protein EXN66_Car012314 [Channa argus]